MRKEILGACEQVPRRPINGQMDGGGASHVRHLSVDRVGPST